MEFRHGFLARAEGQIKPVVEQFPSQFPLTQRVLELPEVERPYLRLRVGIQKNSGGMPSIETDLADVTNERRATDLEIPFVEGYILLLQEQFFPMYIYKCRTRDPE